MRALRSLTTKLLVAAAAPLVVIALLALLLMRALAQVSQAGSWVDHTERAIVLADLLGDRVSHAESIARGYVITGDEEFAREYLSTIDDVDRLAATLRQHVSDNPPQVDRVDRVLRLVHEWELDVAGPLIEARRHEPEAQVLDLARARISIHTNQELHGVVADFVQTEQSLLDIRIERSNRALHDSQIVAGLGTALAGLALITAGAWFAQDVARRLRRVADASEKMLHGELGARSGVDGKDEVARTAQAFDAMAASMEAREHDREHLRELSDLLHSCSTTDEAFEVLARLGPPTFGDANGKLLMINASRNQLVEAVSFQLPSSPDAVFDPDDCWAIRRGRRHVVPDTKRGMVCRHLPHDLPKAYQCEPLLAQGETVGVLYLEDRWDGARGELLSRIGEQLGLTLGNLRLRDRLRNQSLRDPLTGLFNRRYFDETLTRELAHAARTRRPLGVLFVDVDHFKRFNDTHGHDGGDAVLREVGAVLRNEFRVSDFACRYGGEEFAVVLLDASPEDVVKRAETLRTKIKAIRAMANGHTLGTITVSIGVASYPAEGDTVEALVKAADAALYRAKANGRDRVELASG